jgi:hypothetical protein
MQPGIVPINLNIYNISSIIHARHHEKLFMRYLNYLCQHNVERIRNIKKGIS